MRHLFIINPAAGKRETTPQLEALLEKLSFPHEVAYTRGEGDARRLTRSVEAAAAKLGSVEKACELLDITMEDYIRARERSSGEQ